MDTLSELTPEKIQDYGVAILALAGSVGIVGSALAARLPPHWRFTQVMARLFADLRGIRQPTTEQQTQLHPLPPPAPKRKG